MRKNKKLLYQQSQLPIFQNRMYDTQVSACACPKGDMQLVENQQTGLIYNDAFRPELMIYDTHYQNEQALSPSFRTHLESVAQIVERCMGRDLIVEVGCGKGFFLEMLLLKGIDVSGFDPTYEGDNPKIAKQYFASGTAISASSLVLRHVLEHIQDPYHFLLQLKEANGGGGRIYIEVPCFEWICDHRAWFDIFYEHVNYFRISDFYRMFDTVIESGQLFGEQYIYIVADLATLKPPKINFDDCATLPNDFVQSIFKPSLRQAGQAAIWGGASKGVIFALLKYRSGQAINTVIDINPAKQGRYLPASGLLVQSPLDALPLLPVGSTIFIMNSNYLEEIKTMSNHSYKYVEIGHD